MSGQLGIEHQTVLGLPPVEFVNLAADLHCPYIAIVLGTRPHNPHRYPEYSLLKDAALRSRMLTAMGDRGVSVFLGEGFVVQPGLDVGQYEADLDVMAELRAAKVNLVSFDPDLSRSFDAFGQLAEMAAERGLPRRHHRPLRPRRRGAAAGGDRSPHAVQGHRRRADRGPGPALRAGGPRPHGDRRASVS